MTFPAARLAALAERTAKTVLERCERHSDYPFIDLKYQVAGRREVSAADPWYARRDIIYSWIQGRGLEVLGQYALRDASARGRCRKVLAGIVANLEGLRAGNGGRMHFMMTADGRFLTVGDAGEALPAPPAGAVNYSDLFYLKGAVTAAAALGDGGLLGRTAAELFRAVRAVLEGNFTSDQVSFDRGNPAGRFPDGCIAGPAMVALAAASGAGEFDREHDWEGTAAALIRRVLRRHIDRGELRFHEAADVDGTPLALDGVVICDPGHALEWMGLAARSALRFTSPEGEAIRGELAGLLPELLEKIFRAAIRPEAGGMVKTMDAVSGRAVNSDMPWWNLPETIRAAALTGRLRDFPARAEIMAACAAMLLDYYIVPEAGGLALPNRSATGAVSSAIPAVPDADPGYHVCLPLWDLN